MQLKKRHSHDMIFNEEVSDLVDTKEQMDLKKEETLVAIKNCVF